MFEISITYSDVRLSDANISPERERHYCMTKKPNPFALDRNNVIPHAYVVLLGDAAAVASTPIVLLSFRAWYNEDERKRQERIHLTTMIRSFVRYCGYLRDWVITRCVLTWCICGLHMHDTWHPSLFALGSSTSRSPCQTHQEKQKKNVLFIWYGTIDLRERYHQHHKTGVIMSQISRWVNETRDRKQK